MGWMEHEWARLSWGHLLMIMWSAAIDCEEEQQVGSIRLWMLSGMNDTLEQSEGHCFRPYGEAGLLLPGSASASGLEQQPNGQWR